MQTCCCCAAVKQAARLGFLLSWRVPLAWTSGSAHRPPSVAATAPPPHASPRCLCLVTLTAGSAAHTLPLSGFLVGPFWCASLPLPSPPSCAVCLPRRRPARASPGDPLAPPLAPLLPPPRLPCRRPLCASLSLHLLGMCLVGRPSRPPDLPRSSRSRSLRAAWLPPQCDAGNRFPVPC